jgi:hypothetical protein
VNGEGKWEVEMTNRRCDSHCHVCGISNSEAMEREDAGACRVK